MAENITGTLQFRDIEFYFLFENGILNLYPNLKDFDDVDSWFRKKTSEDSFVYGSLPLVNEDYIKATTTTGKTCFFFPYLKSEIARSNHLARSNLGMVLYISIQSYLLSPECIDTFQSIEFFSPELDLFYPIHDVINVEHQDSSLTVQYDYSKELNSDDTLFKYNEIDWVMNFNRVLTTKQEIYRSPVISVSTEMKLTPSEELNISILPKIYRIMKRFMAFCSHRNNASFSKIRVSFNDSGYPFPLRGDFIVLADENQEPDITALKKNKIICYQDISENLSLLLQDIIEEKIYLRSLPKDSEDFHQYDIPKFIMVAAGFDSEFKRMYPKPDYEALNTIRNHYSEKTGKSDSNSTTETKEIKKFHPYMKEKMVFAHISFKNIIDPLLIPRYKALQHPYDIYQLAERVARQRNNFAHGDLTQEIDLEAIIDLQLWLEVLIFVMQLSYYSLPDKTVNSILGKIFDLYPPYGFTDITK